MQADSKGCSEQRHNRLSVSFPLICACLFFFLLRIPLIIYEDVCVLVLLFRHRQRPVPRFPNVFSCLNFLISCLSHQIAALLIILLGYKLDLVAFQTSRFLSAPSAVVSLLWEAIRISKEVPVVVSTCCWTNNPSLILMVPCHFVGGGAFFSLILKLEFFPAKGVCMQCRWVNS